jgi:hypothetical protein
VTNYNDDPETYFRSKSQRIREISEAAERRRRNCQTLFIVCVIMFLLTFCVVFFSSAAWGGLI